MLDSPQRTSRGKHRATPSSNHRTRIAVLAASAGVISTAGAGGALAAHQGDAASPANSTIELASDSSPINSSDAGSDFTPQILAIAEFKPAQALDEQLKKALDYSAQRAAEDLAARGPEVALPAEGVLSSTFGSRWGAFHSGVDIANAQGTPIYAAMDGVVINSGPASGYGQWIRILHEDGTITVYGHMSRLDVREGEHVKAGQQIAGMGSLGFSTGPHLHFEVHPAGGPAIDPLPWLAERGIVL